MLDSARRTSSSSTRATPNDLRDHADAGRRHRRLRGARLRDRAGRRLRRTALGRRLGGDGRIDIYVDRPLAAQRPAAVRRRDARQQLHGVAEIRVHRIRPHVDERRLGLRASLRSRTSSSISSSSGSGSRGTVRTTGCYEGCADWMGCGSTATARGRPELGPDDMTLDCRESRSARTRSAASRTTIRTTATRAGRSSSTSPRSTGHRSSRTSSRRAGGERRRRPAAVSAALVAKGPTLADIYNAWSTVQMTGATRIDQLHTAKPDAVRRRADRHDDGRNAAVAERLRRPSRHALHRVLPRQQRPVAAPATRRR